MMMMMLIKDEHDDSEMAPNEHHVLSGPIKNNIDSCITDICSQNAPLIGRMQAHKP